MIELKTELGIARIVQSLEELPILPEDVQDVFIDIESTSFDKDVAAFLPYSGHRVAGIAITWDKEPGAWYIPIRHTDKRWNLSIKKVIEWLQEEADKAKRWRNHNVKFDAHFLSQDGFEWKGKWSCSLNESKMLHSDRHSHRLKLLCREWASLPMEEELDVASYLKGIKSKNYGDVPADIMGKYACMDVMGNRALCGFIDKIWPDSLCTLREQESKLTPVLFDIEQSGLRADRLKTRVEALLAIRRITNIATQIAEIIGFEFTDSNKVLTQILLSKYGLPVLGRTKKKNDSGGFTLGGPSFEKKTLSLYSLHEDVLRDPELVDLIDLIIRYREESTFYGLFLSKYIELADAEFFLHPFYNQNVRTGRMSCSNPNSQQLNMRAKALIIPEEDEAFLYADASQVEFRIIVHYIEDEEAIEAYKSDPRTDFHRYVTDMAQCSSRSEGKTLNFAVAFGQGVKTTVAQLSTSPGILALVYAELGEGADIEDIRRRCRFHARQVYERYHARFPGIKETSYAAYEACRARGFVFNLFGRRRYLPRKASHKAFNSIVQGTASDIVKSRMIALAPRFNDRMRRWGIRIKAQVHDEILLVGPKKILQDPEFHAYLNSVLEEVPIPLSVPILWNLGYSETSWAVAAGDAVTNEDGVKEGRIIIAA